MLKPLQYPAFLEENKGKLPAEEYERFSKQYEYIQRICHIYETQPKNTAEVMVVMQEVELPNHRFNFPFS